MINSNSQKSASEEHENLVNLAAQSFNGKKVIIRGNYNIKGQYFPDVISNEIDIECEIMPKSYIEKKIRKWNPKRKKILIISYSKKAIDNFDLIYVHDIQTIN